MVKIRNSRPARRLPGTVDGRDAWGETRAFRRSDWLQIGIRKFLIATNPSTAGSPRSKFGICSRFEGFRGPWMAGVCVKGGESLPSVQSVSKSGLEQVFLVFVGAPEAPANFPAARDRARPSSSIAFADRRPLPRRRRGGGDGSGAATFLFLLLPSMASNRSPNGTFRPGRSRRTPSTASVARISRNSESAARLRGFRGRSTPGTRRGR